MDNSRIMITGGIVITMDDEEKIYSPGWLLVEDNKIVNLGEGSPPDLPGICKYIDASGKVIMPGIVNIHTHVCGSLVKALTEDRSTFYSLALPMERFLTPEYAYILSLLGCIETVKAGSTCINDMYHFMRSGAKAVEEIGLRAVLAHNVYEVDLYRLQFGDYTYNTQQGINNLEENIKLIEEFHNKANGKITCRFGPHAPDTCSTELLCEMSRLANEYGVGLHMHVAQSEQETEFIKNTHGVSPIQYLENIGMTGGNLIAAHCILADERDIQILKKTNTIVAHCPTIYCKRGTFPPMQSMYGSNVKIALGTDWVSMDPWDNMRFAIGGGRLSGCQDEIINSHKAFRMSTIDAAKYLGLDSIIGSLESGKRADLIIIDINKAHLQPAYDDIIATLVYNANGNDVETVMVDGQIIVENGKMKMVDEKDVIKEARKVALHIYNSQKQSQKN